jgi:hypothetical protein
MIPLLHVLLSLTWMVDLLVIRAGGVVDSVAHLGITLVVGSLNFSCYDRHASNMVFKLFIIEESGLPGIQCKSLNHVVKRSTTMMI